MLETKTIFYRRFSIAILFFTLSATYGWLMRVQKVFPIPGFKYGHFIQAHSHVTFLGWGFLGVISLITYVYFPSMFSAKKNKVLFYAMVLSMLGLLISFPLEGYKLFSILFLSVFLLISYAYLWDLYKNFKKIKIESSRFIKSGILYYYLSSMAIWAIAIIAVKIGKNDLYHNAIYFYLHFLYNGFFVMILFGLFIKYLENKGIISDKKNIELFFLTTNVAVIPAYALSLLWSKMPFYIEMLAFVAAIIQLLSLLYLWKILKSFFQSQKKKSFIKYLSYVIFISFFLKIVLQFFSAFPGVTPLVVQYKPFLVIGYIHLFTLGFMSSFIFLLLELLGDYKPARIGMYLFLSGVVLSELMLFGQGALLYTIKYNINNFNGLLMLVSTLMPLGIAMLIKRKYF